MTADEHTRLLKPSHDDGHRQNYGREPMPGPLDLPQSTRYGILVGVWIANFLSVCVTLIRPRDRVADHSKGIEQYVFLMKYPVPVLTLCLASDHGSDMYAHTLSKP